MKRLIIAFTLMLLCGTAWADSANVTATNDGYTYGGSIIGYAFTRDAAAGTAAITTSIKIGQDYSAPDYTVNRSFLSFAIPNMSAVSAVSLFLNGLTDNSNTDFGVYIVTSTYSNPFVKEDYDLFDGRQVAAPHNGTILNSTWDSSTFAAGWNEIVFDADGLTAVLAKSNSTFLITLLSKEDYDNSAPTDSEYLSFQSSEAVGEEPYLAITYTSGTIEKHTSYTFP